MGLMAKRRVVAALMGDGRIGLVEQDIPPVKPGAVLVEVKASLVSPGTEVGGWRQLKDQRSNPKPDAKPVPFGYANAGVVAEVGEGVTDLAVGDRVACMGGGYALHTDHAVVPHNLCALMPNHLSFEGGAYGHLAATAMNALRRGQPEFGEFVAVVGLGLVGMLTAKLHQLAGNYVIGWDTIAFRTELAGRRGIDAVVQVGVADEVEATNAFTGGMGLDAAVLVFGGPADATVASVEKCLKRSPDGHPMGRIVVVGGSRFAYNATLTNIDVRRASRTGPGYHDEGWEYGPDYPAVFMRWTTKTNLALCLRLMAEGKVDFAGLTTHRIPLGEVEQGVNAIIDDPDSILGVVFEM